jgi:transposase
MATWLWTELKQLGLPMICIDARHAKAVLKMQINKSDRNGAAGIARIMQTGWFKEVRGALLVKIKRDLENQIRGLLKNVGLVIGHPSASKRWSGSRWTIRGAGRGQRLRSAVNRRQWSRPGTVVNLGQVYSRLRLYLVEDLTERLIESLHRGNSMWCARAPL